MIRHFNFCMLLGIFILSGCDIDVKKEVEEFFVDSTIPSGEVVNDENGTGSGTDLSSFYLVSWEKEEKQYRTMDGYEELGDKGIIAGRPYKATGSYTFSGAEHKMDGDQIVLQPLVLDYDGNREINQSSYSKSYLGWGPVVRKKLCYDGSVTKKDYTFWLGADEYKWHDEVFEVTPVYVWVEIPQRVLIKYDMKDVVKVWIARSVPNGEGADDVGNIFINDTTGEVTYYGPVEYHEWQYAAYRNNESMVAAFGALKEDALAWAEQEEKNRSTSSGDMLPEKINLRIK